MTDERSRRQEQPDNIVDYLELDHWLITGAVMGDGERRTSQVIRTPLRPGKGSVFLNRVSLISPGDAAIELVEKGVNSDSPELLFWRQTRASRPVLRGKTFEVVEPIGIVDRDVLSALYFRYLPRLDREIKLLQREFRANVRVGAAAVAELNGRNLVASISSPLSRGNPFSAARPSRDDLQRRLDTTRKTARGLQRSWDGAHRGWLAVRSAYERLPQCLCHNDVSPGNSVHVDAAIRFADFGLAGVGPVGSDLHALIRWSGKAMADDDHVEDLIKTYLDGLKPYVPAASSDEVRLAAWATFFLRYTNLKLSSARYLHTYDLAVRKMREMASAV
jgi:hypothetical protein